MAKNGEVHVEAALPGGRNWSVVRRSARIILAHAALDANGGSKMFSAGIDGKREKTVLDLQDEANSRLSAIHSINKLTLRLPHLGQT
jgi:hypothetical protein